MKTFIFGVWKKQRIEHQCHICELFSSRRWHKCQYLQKTALDLKSGSQCTVQWQCASKCTVLQWMHCGGSTSISSSGRYHWRKFLMDIWLDVSSGNIYLGHQLILPLNLSMMIKMTWMWRGPGHSDSASVHFRKFYFSLYRFFADWVLSFT